MDRQKLVALAKQLEELVEQDNSESTILAIQTCKTENYPGTITIRVSRFLKHDFFEFNKFYWEDYEELNSDIEIDNVTFQYRYFRAVGKGVN